MVANVNTNSGRVVITGMGIISPLGNDVDTFWDKLIHGTSGIGPMTLCDTTDYPCKIAGEASEFDPHEFIEAKESNRLSRFIQIAIASSLMAVEHSQLNLSKIDLNRTGVILGNGNGGFPTLESSMRTLVSRGGSKISPFFIPTVLPNMASAAVSRFIKATGYNATIATACAAGTHAIGEAAEIIKRGTTDIMITGGTEAGISQLGLAGFCSMRALSTYDGDPTKASRPFDKNRDGFVPAEGSGTLILEELNHALNRNATIYGEIIGFGVSSDAFHPVQPEQNGLQAANAMSLALGQANLLPKDIDYINAHGTSTPLNDMIETKTIKRVFGDDAINTPISSTKSMIGHALGGAGAMEAIACIQTINSGIIHPTINLDTPDPECDLDYVANESRCSDVYNVLSNSFGFGGQNSCIILQKYRD